MKIVCKLRNLPVETKTIKDNNSYHDKLADISLLQYFPKEGFPVGNLPGLDIGVSPFKATCQ